MTTESANEWCYSRVSNISSLHFHPHIGKEGCHLICFVLACRDLAHVTHWAVEIADILRFSLCSPSEGDGIHSAFDSFLKTDRWCVVTGWESSAGVGSSVCLLSHFCHTFQSGYLQVTLASDATLVHFIPEASISVLGFWFFICLVNMSLLWTVDPDLCAVCLPSY